MKASTLFFLSTSLALFFVMHLYSYIELNSKTTVSPGYEGGIISQCCISTMPNSYTSENQEEPYNEIEIIEAPKSASSHKIVEDASSIAEF